MRIQGELLKLGIGVSATTVASVVAQLGPGAGTAAPRPRLVGVPARPSAQHARRRSKLGADRQLCGGRRRPRGQRTRAEPAGPGWVGWPGRSRRQPLPGRCCRASARVSAAASAEPLGASARSPCDSSTVAPTAIASIACPRRSPKSRPALVPQPNASAATSRPSPVAPRVRTNHASDPSADPRPTAPRRQRNRSTTTPSRQPEPSFFTLHASYSWMNSPSRSRRRRRAVVFCGVGSRPFGGRRWSARWGESAETNEPDASRSRGRVCEPYGNLRCSVGLLRCLAQARVAPSCLPRRLASTLELDAAARAGRFSLQISTTEFTNPTGRQREGTRRVRESESACKCRKDRQEAQT